MPGPTAVYVTRPGWAPRLLSMPKAISVLAHRAGLIAAAANGYSPTDKVSYSSHPTADGAVVTSGSPLWHLIEFGSAYAGVHSPPYAPLRRAVDSIPGLLWVQTGGPGA